MIINNNNKKLKVSKVGVNKSGIDVCKHCSKRHKSEACWKIAVCDLCKVTGHIARFCPTCTTTNPVKPENSKKTVSVAGVFNKK